VEQYQHATTSVPARPNSSNEKYLRGFIFLETDRISSTEESTSEPSNIPGWKHALDEVSFLSRIAQGKPVNGEGHLAADKEICLGIVPWAPVPGGPSALSSYVEKVKERTETQDIWRKVCGVRYLVQDKPSGVMLEEGFIDGLRWLGKQGLAFDLGVDARQGGLGQLREAVEMMERVFSAARESGETALTIVISEFIQLRGRVVHADILVDHLCKPNLRIATDSLTAHPEYLEWKDLVTRMAQASPANYMKLSGAFSEILPLSEDEVDIDGLASQIEPWTDVVFDAFGPDRVMFGSDWPVANIGGGGNNVAWSRWIRVVETILDRRGLTEEAKEGVWGQVAVKAYGIQL
jgi:L-rhamnono-1,4-lactonase